MQVFQSAVKKNGGSLPLSYYLQPDVGTTPDIGAAPYRGKPIDLVHTRVDRRTFFECLLNDENLALLTTFLLSGVQVNATRDDDGATALHVASAGTVRPLNEAGPQSGGDMSDLHSIRQIGNVMRSRVDGEDRGGTSCILNAPCQNKTIISFLIDNGADVNAAMRGGQGQTPLMVAASRQKNHVVQLLLTKGADLNVQDGRGRTVLSYAVAYPYVMETLRVWMGEQAFYEAAKRERLLHVACRSFGNTFVVLYLIEQIGINVNMRDDEEEEEAGAVSSGALPNRACLTGARAARPDVGDSRTLTTTTFLTPLAGGDQGEVHRAQGSAQSFDDASVPPTNHITSKTGAHLPTHLGAGDAVSPVTAEISNMNALQSGATALHHAVVTGDVTLVWALLTKGANIYAADNSGATPLQRAQSRASCMQSWKQYCKDQLVVLLWPHSAMAAAAQHRLAEQEREADFRKMRALLTAYSHANTTHAREKVLHNDSVWSPWRLCRSIDRWPFLAVATLPNIFFYICCSITDSFFLLLLMLVVSYGSYFRMKQRSLQCITRWRRTGLGWWFTFLSAQAIAGCATVYYYYTYYSFSEEDHRMATLWLTPASVATLALAVYVPSLSPGIVRSTEGQRKGIYASLRGAKGEYPKEFLYSTDLRTMVRKPLRAQYCPQAQCVVLRYNHFSFDIGLPIGGGNHRAFLWMHVVLLWLLSCLYCYAREYHRLMSSITRVAATIGGTAVHEHVKQHFLSVGFATAERRFVYMQTQALLPLLMLALLYSLWTHVLRISRNVTSYDLEHSEGESSLYCFTLDGKVYSLFDYGKWCNLREFWGWSSLTTQLYRVPQINDHLQRVITDHQRWQVSSSQACSDHHCHSHQTDTHTRERIHTHGTEATASVTAALPATEIPVHSANGDVGTHPSSNGEGHNSAKDSAHSGSALSNRIFHEMVRSGSVDVRCENVGTSMAAARGSDDEQVQQEWEAALKRAREMYRFYMQSIENGEGGLLWKGEEKGACANSPK